MNVLHHHRTIVIVMLHVLIYLERTTVLVNLDLMEMEPIAQVWLRCYTSIEFFRMAGKSAWDNHWWPRNRKIARNFGKNRTKIRLKPKNRTKMDETANRRNVRNRKTASKFWKNRKTAQKIASNRKTANL